MRRTLPTKRFQTAEELHRGKVVNIDRRRVAVYWCANDESLWRRWIRSIIWRVSAMLPAVTDACDGPTNMKPVKLVGLTEVVTFRFVELFDLNVLPRQVDGTRLALILPLLDFAMDDLPVRGCAAFPKAPLLELAFVLSFAVSMSESLSATQYPRHRSTYLLSKLYVTFM
jgi:hypothetical protein